MIGNTFLIREREAQTAWLTSLVNRLMALLGRQRWPFPPCPAGASQSSEGKGKETAKRNEVKHLLYGQGKWV